jgi:dethiobiotin synthetase
VAGILVTATDTGVGKTVVACALLRLARARGRSVAGFKPFESGCTPGPDGSLVPADAVALRTAAAMDEPLDAVCLHRFAEPLAPGIAAARAGASPDLAPAVAAYAQLERAHDLVVVEGAGGLLVPLTPRHDVADLGKALALPLVIVARAGLGTLNHSLLTVEAARRRGLRVLAVVLCHGAAAVVDDPSVTDNAGVIARHGGVPVLGPVPPAGPGSADPSEDPAVQAALRPLADRLTPDA